MNKTILSLVVLFLFTNLLGITSFKLVAECKGEEIASWYGNESIVPKWKGFTKNGEKFDENKLTCAMPDVSQINKRYKVTNLANGKSVIVWANDTGNLKKYSRAIDLSKRAFSQISDLKKGLIKVKIEEKK